MLALVALVLVTSSACDVWEQLGRGPDNSRFNPDEVRITPDDVGSLAQVWTSRAGSFSEPILSGDRLYTTVATTTGGSVRAYDVRTGAVAWETPLPAARQTGSVVLADGALWVGQAGAGGVGCQDPLTRLDPRTGQVLTTETGPAVVEAVVASDTTTAFTSQGCSQTASPPQLVVRDRSSATPSWTHQLPADAQPTMPSIGQGRVFVAAGDSLYAFDAAGCGATTCQPLWVTSLDVGDDNFFAGEDRPVVGPDGIVYVGGELPGGETLVRAVDAETGAHLWRTDSHPAPGPGWQGLALADDRLYISDQRLDSPSGGAVEVFPATGCGQPVCAPAWSASIDGPPVAELTVGGDVLYLGVYREGDSRFVAFDAGGCGAAVCTRLANMAFGSQQPQRVAVAGGRVAVVGTDATGATLRVLAPRS